MSNNRSETIALIKRYSFKDAIYALQGKQRQQYLAAWHWAVWHTDGASKRQDAYWKRYGTDATWKRINKVRAWLGMPAV